MGKKFLSIFAFLFFLLSVAQAEEKFPFLGEVNSDRVNLRAGPNINFERLLQLNKGDTIVVMERSFNWLKVKLPPQAPCYMKSDFIKILEADVGKVTGNRVHLRARAGENYSSIGKLSKGTVVRVLGETNGWYRLEPIEGAFGWLNDEYVTFKSENIPPAHLIAEPIRNIYLKKKLEQEKQQAGTLGQLSSPPPPENILSVQGRLEDLGRIFRAKELRYKLVIDNQTAYYLIGDGHMFDRIINQRVSVQGKLMPTEADRYKHPVIIVSEIHLVVSETESFQHDHPVEFEEFPGLSPGNRKAIPQGRIVREAPILIE